MRLGAGIFGSALLVAAIAAASTVAFGHGTATGVVKERMDAMMAMRDAAKVVGGMAKGESPYDAKAVREQAEIIRSHAGKSLTGKFPKGTGGMPSEARDEIWSDWEEFERIAGELEVLAEGLVNAAGNGLSKERGATPTGEGTRPDLASLAAMPADEVFLMVGRTCSACHEKFRLKKN